MTEAPDAEAVRALLRESDAAFAAGDADRWADCFADDGRVLLLHRAPIEGRPSIRSHWREWFARYDTSAWDPRTELVELHGDHAYAYGTYTERLVSRDDGSKTLVRGRLVHFLRREPDGTWRIRLIMNSHSHPMEPEP